MGNFNSNIFRIYARWPEYAIKPSEQQNLTSVGDCNIMTQNSNLINFGMDFIIEIINLDLFKNSESFILKKISEKFNLKE